jgi:hypothetical protein
MSRSRLLAGSDVQPKRPETGPPNGVTTSRRTVGRKRWRRERNRDPTFFANRVVGRKAPSGRHRSQLIVRQAGFILCFAISALAVAWVGQKTAPTHQSPKLRAWAGSSAQRQNVGRCHRGNVLPDVSARADSRIELDSSIRRRPPQRGLGSIGTAARPPTFGA